MPPSKRLTRRPRFSAVQATTRPPRGFEKNQGTKAVSAAYVTGDSDVTFAQVADVLDIASRHLDHMALLPRSSVLDRKAYPGETDSCVDVTFTMREANTSDRQSAVWR